MSITSSPIIEKKLLHSSLFKETLTRKIMLEAVLELRNNYRIKGHLDFVRETGLVKETWEGQRFYLQRPQYWLLL